MPDMGLVNADLGTAELLSSADLPPLPGYASPGQLQGDLLDPLSDAGRSPGLKYEALVGSPGEFLSLDTPKGGSLGAFGGVPACPGHTCGVLGSRLVTSPWRDLAAGAKRPGTAAPSCTHAPPAEVLGRQHDATAMPCKAVAEAAPQPLNSHVCEMVRRAGDGDLDAAFASSATHFDQLGQWGLGQPEHMDGATSGQGKR